jgi:hypothetical protein
LYDLSGHSILGIRSTNMHPQITLCTFLVWNWLFQCLVPDMLGNEASASVRPVVGLADLTNALLSTPPHQSAESCSIFNLLTFKCRMSSRRFTRPFEISSALSWTSEKSNFWTMRCTVISFVWPCFGRYNLLLWGTKSCSCWKVVLYVSQIIRWLLSWHDWARLMFPMISSMTPFREASQHGAMATILGSIPAWI